MGAVSFVLPIDSADHDGQDEPAAEVDGALSRALELAAARGDLEAVKAIVRELEARRLAGSNVRPIAFAKTGRS